MRQGLIALSLIVVCGIGCQSSMKKISQKSAPRKVRARGPTKDMASKIIPDLPRFNNQWHEEDDFLKTIPQEGTNSKGPLELTEREKIYFELAGEKAEALTENEIYQKAQEKYQQGDGVALEAYTNLLQKKYSKSKYCDNLLYLLGLFSLSNKNYGESLGFFQKILSGFPQSNKAVSALYAKGIIFKKMNLHSQAQGILDLVVQKYPGSPEYFKAQEELKVILR